MAERLRELLVGVVIAVIAYLKPIDGELKALALVFFLNFVFGYLSGMIAKGEKFELKKALICVGHATIYFVLCAAVYTIGRWKGQMDGAIQCVSMITYVVIYFYGINITQKMIEIFKKGTPPWMVANFLHYCLGLYFLERVPFLSSFLTHTNNRKEINHVNYNRQSLEKDGYTISRIYVNGELFGCNTLEDTDRGLRQDMQLEEIKKKKVYGQTAIPRGSYECVYTYSNRFKKMLPLLNDVPGFDGIRIHSGNSAKDTDGCILVGLNLKKGMVLNSREWTNKLIQTMKTAWDKKEKVTILIQ